MENNKNEKELKLETISNNDTESSKSAPDHIEIDFTPTKKVESKKKSSTFRVILIVVGAIVLGLIIENVVSNIIAAQRRQEWEDFINAANAVISESNENIDFEPGITLDNYKRIKEGMTLSQVEEILGGKGQLGAVMNNMYDYWWTKDDYSARVEVVIENNRVTGMAYYGSE